MEAREAPGAGIQEVTVGLEAEVEAADLISLGLEQVEAAAEDTAEAQEAGETTCPAEEDHMCIPS